MLGYGWFSLISFITLLLVTGILIMYSVGTKQIEYFVVLSLTLGNASLMIHELFEISILNFSAVSMFFFVIGTFLSIRLIVDSIEEYNNS
jgi:hypothetical protein